MEDSTRVVVVVDSGSPVLASGVAAGPFALAVVWGLAAIAAAGGPLPVPVATARSCSSGGFWSQRSAVVIWTTDRAVGRIGVP